ncbi:hypothetical protein SAMN02745166_03221 [Prosthecobacter debontii]|uniref:Uncharacterized protein n=1 Tax=Prosthecobacter debontii TaxID=48467 RepID=A0A1T4YG42_9BACT|nr:hypothetical protein [Prosthecobacter debontii]SKB00787.1 hypothetical protein SAMN02745166_03221 [Prosthecobacter debontii]
MKRRRVWLIAGGLLILIWSGVAIVMKQTDPLVSWPEKVIALAEEAPWLHGDEGTYESRHLYLDRLITNQNRLDVSQRRRLREEGQEVLDKFFTSLTEEEQKEYVNRTVDPHLDNLDRGLKLLPTEERKRLVMRMRNDLKNLRGRTPDGDRLSDQDREFMDMMVSEDPVLFLRAAPLKTKMELAPVLEDLQSRVQGLRR